MWRRTIAKIRFPMLGYVLFLLGFVSLGLFVASLALARDVAPVLGATMVACYAAGVGCFRFRRWQMANQEPDAAVKLGFDPMRGDTMRDAERRYLQTYRGVVVDETGCEVRQMPERRAPRASSVLAVERRSA